MPNNDSVSENRAEGTKDKPALEPRRPWGARQMALLLGALALALYLRTMAPGLLAGDPGEFQFAAWRLGLAHPTGYPLYLLLGHLWQTGLGLVGISPAAALNGFSAFCSAAVVGLFLIAQSQWLTVFCPGFPSIRLAAATVSTIFFALNPTFWNQSLIAEVYSLHMLFVVLISLALWQCVAGIAQNANQARLWFFGLCGLLGLSLAHHGMTVWLLPGVALTLIWAKWRTFNQADTNDLGEIKVGWSGTPLRAARTLLVGATLIAIPLLLYFYIPLRSGPDASPWYHQRLGDAPLTLYENSWSGFVQFFTGESISVGFRTLGEAMAQLSFALIQWQIHFTTTGLLLIFAGLYALVATRQWTLLIFSGTYFLLQQGFNLFYAIGDIFVYYIPLFWIGTVWIGVGLAAGGNWLAGSFEQLRQNQLASRNLGDVDENDASLNKTAHRNRMSRRRGWQADTASNGTVFLIVLFTLIPLQIARAYFPQIDQSENVGTRLRWEEILAAGPPDNAILVSNDRNEIVPLFYLQYVEKRVPNMVGLFPLIAPEERFADVGATVGAALTEGNGQPVVLVKPMAGLEARFELEDLEPPLVSINGEYPRDESQFVHSLPYGPLTLLGYIWRENLQQNDVTDIVLTWQVDAPIGDSYTTSVQLFAADGERITQDDRIPGGEYYPTNLWKAGEVIRDAHSITLPSDVQPAMLLITMYRGPNFEQLAPALEIKLPALP